MPAITPSAREPGPRELCALTETAIDAYGDLLRHLTLLAREMHTAGLITDNAVTIVLAHADQTAAALATSRRRIHNLVTATAMANRPTIGSPRPRSRPNPGRPDHGT